MMTCSDQSDKLLLALCPGLTVGLGEVKETSRLPVSALIRTLPQKSPSRDVIQAELGDGGRN